MRDFGEVYTHPREVKAMCDLLPQSIWENISATFLEPSCGSGNFLVEILERKLKFCHSVFDTYRALGAIYGIELLGDNVRTSRKRLFALISAWHRAHFHTPLPLCAARDIATILRLNIVQTTDTLSDEQYHNPRMELPKYAFSIER